MEREGVPRQAVGRLARMAFDAGGFGNERVTESSVGQRDRMDPRVVPRSRFVDASGDQLLDGQLVAVLAVECFGRTRAPGSRGRSLWRSLQGLGGELEARLGGSDAGLGVTMRSCRGSAPFNR
jgi:hypothetical protein